jgi:hypothetical protein
VQRWAYGADAPLQLRSAAPADAGLCVYSDGCGSGNLVLFACHAGPPAGFSAQQGFLAANNDVMPPAFVNVSTARAMCAANQFCAALTFASADPTCGEAAGGECDVFFKNKVFFSGAPGWTTLVANWSAPPDAAGAPSGPAGGVGVGVGSCCPGASVPYCNTQFTFAPDGSLRAGGADGVCVTAPAQPGLALSLAPCDGGAAQQFYRTATDGSVRAGAPGAGGAMCLSADASPTSTWLKELSSGSYAVGAINAGDLFNATAACDGKCLLGATGWLPGQLLSVRNVWAHAFLPNITAGDGWTSPSLAPSGGHAMHILTPLF